MTTLDELNNEANALLIVAPRCAATLARTICERATAEDDAPALALALCTLADFAAIEHNVSEADARLAEAERLDAHVTLPEVRLRWFAARGAVAHLRGDLKDALIQVNDALALAERLDHRLDQARLLDLLGDIHASWGALQSALRLHTESRELFERLGHAVGQIRCFSHIAAVHTRLGQHAQAIEALERSMTCALELADRQLEAQRDLQLATSLSAMGRHAHAIERLEHALTGWTSPPLHFATAVHRAMADALMGLGRYDEAFDHLRHSQALAHDAGSEEARLLALIGRGRLHLHQHHHREAREVLTEALDLTEAPALAPMRYAIHLLLCEASKGLGDLAAALAHYERFHAIKEDVLLCESQRRLDGVVTRLEAEQLRRERELERLRVAELGRINEVLATRNQQLEQLNVRLAELSTRDSLTGLYNRRYLDQFLEREVGRAQRYGEPLAVAMIDIDHFKRINDTLSHATGDLVLIELSHILHENTRGVDVVGRHGGEEFLVVFPHTTLGAASDAAQKLRSIVEHHRFRLDPTLRMTVSIGLAACRPDDTPAILVDRADAELYAAKQAGRNRVCVAPA